MGHLARMQTVIFNLILQTKKELGTQGHEAVTNDVVAQIHIDEKAEQLFLWADTEDRNANFNKYVKLVL